MYIIQGKPEKRIPKRHNNTVADPRFEVTGGPLF